MFHIASLREPYTSSRVVETKKRKQHTTETGFFKGCSKENLKLSEQFMELEEYLWSGQ